MPTSSLLTLDGRRIVVDCGLGVTRGLCDAGMALADLRTIFVTHLHSDHYLELGALVHTAWTAGLTTPVDVWGPPGLDRYWRHFLASMDADIALRIADEGRPDLAPLLRVRTLREGPVTRVGPIEVAALRTEHPPLVECFALSFRGARHVVFSGDTAPLPALAAFASNADLLVHEAMLDAALPALVARVGNGDARLMTHLRRSHTAARDAARIAARARAGALALNHLIPSDDPAYGPGEWTAEIAPHFSGPVHLGTDGLRIAL